MQNNNPRFSSLFKPESPLHTAPASIQKYFQSLDSSLRKLPNITHPFELKLSPKHNCTKIIRPNQKYYHCNDCSYDQIIDTMIYCESCFIPTLHEGHKYKEEIIRDATCRCDCGRSLRLKGETMCGVHRDKNRKIEINEEDKRNFLTYFGKWFQILQYMKAKCQQKDAQELQGLFIETLVDLSEESLYYTRLIQLLFSSEIKLQQIFTSKCYADLMLQLIGDDEYIIPFGEFFMEMQDKDTINLYHFADVRAELLNSSIFLQYMTKKNVYYPEVFENYLEMVIWHDLTHEDERGILELLEKLMVSTTSEEYIDIIYELLRRDTFSSILNTPQTLNKIYEKVFESSKKYEKQQQGKQKEKEKQEKEKEKEKNSKRKIFKQLKIISSILYLKSQNKIEKLVQTLQNLRKEQERKIEIENCIKIFIQKGYFNHLMSAKKRNELLLVLLVVQNHSQKPRLLQKIWESAINFQKNFRQNLDVIFDFIAFIANSYQTFPILGLDQSFSDLSDLQMRQLLFKSYLYENKQISKSSLWNSHIKGWLKFPSCGKILNKLCKYNDDHETFVYGSQQSYPNNLLKVPLQVSRNWQNVKKMDISYISQSFGKSKILKNIFLTLFGCETFFNLFHRSYLKTLETVQKQPRTLQQWKSKGVSDNYIIILLLADKLCHGQENPIIKQQLDKIRLNIDEYRFGFNEAGNEEKIKKLLCIDDLEKEFTKIEENAQGGGDKANEEQLAREELKKKAQLKKQKLQNKMRQKQTNILEKLKKDKSSIGEEDQQDNFCLSCKERQRKDKQFVYMVYLTRGYSLISKIIHGQESKTQYKISTNLHAIHMTCFQSTKKKLNQFQCQLCKQNINCFLPYKPNIASKKTYEICWNVMNAFLVNNYSIYDTGCLFSVLLECVIESLGFTELVYMNKSKSSQKMKHKADRYLLELLTCIYVFASEYERQKYKEVYNQLKKSIQTCKKKELLNFQLLLLESCFIRISGEGELDKNLLQYLKGVMISKEFVVLKKALALIGEEEGQDELISYETMSMNRISEMEIQQNSSQRKQKEEITSLENIQQNPNSQTGISLGISILKPPKYFHELKDGKFIGTQDVLKCQACDSNNFDVVCLQCHLTFCENCSSDQAHSSLHLNNLLFLNLKQGQISIHKQGESKINLSVYYNDFMMEYKKSRIEKEKKEEENQNEQNENNIENTSFFNRKRRSSMDKNKQKTQKAIECEYRLNEVAFNKLFKKFFNLEQ